MQIGSDAHFACKVLADIAAHPLALDNDFFGSKRAFQRRDLLDVREHLGDVFKAIGLVEMEHDGASGDGWRWGWIID